MGKKKGNIGNLHPVTWILIQVNCRTSETVPCFFLFFSGYILNSCYDGLLSFRNNLFCCVDGTDFILCPVTPLIIWFPVLWNNF